MPTVVLVEDNDADVELFRLALENAGVDCNLIVFEDGRAIIDFVQHYDPAESPSIPQLIVLDLNLPKFDGLEVLEAIRKSPFFANLRVVALSCSASARDRATLSQFQIEDYIVKPSDLDEYLEIGDTIKRLLQKTDDQASHACVIEEAAT